MRSLHHPPSRLPPRILFHTLCLFSPRSNRGNEVKSPEQHTHFIKVVSFIEAHALPFLLCRLRSFDRNTYDGFFRHLEIIPVRSVDGNADRDTLSFSEQAPFCPLFCAVSGIRPSFFPLQAALLSSLHPSNRSSSRCPSIRRIAQGISSRVF